MKKHTLFCIIWYSIIFDANSFCLRGHEFTFISLKSRSIKPYTKLICAHMSKRNMETEREMERRKEKIEKVCIDNFWNILSYVQMGFPGGSEGEETACNARDLGSIPGSGRSPGGGKGSPL